MSEGKKALLLEDGKAAEEERNGRSPRGQPEEAVAQNGFGEESGQRSEGPAERGGGGNRV